MKNNYLFSLFIAVLFTLGANAQDKELGFYPNPATQGKIIITSKTTGDKDVQIFNVLGKLVLQQQVAREMNISNLTPGVYIVKIKEDETTVTRKLIVK